MKTEYDPYSDGWLVPTFAELNELCKNRSDWKLEADQTIEFFHKLTYGEGFSLNVTPWAPEERIAFEQYMKNGGGWVGFHAAAYDDRNTNWPPQPVLQEADTQNHPVTKNLPREFVAPASEWYHWTPSPRESPDVQVLVSLSDKNYPLGIKDIVYLGDWPVVWANRNYRMIYLNMGYGDEECWVVSQDPDGDPFDR